MSKLEEQKALPRRKIYRRAEVVELHATKITDPLDKGVVYQTPKPKRKAKKAKGKR